MSSVLDFLISPALAEAAGEQGEIGVMGLLFPVMLVGLFYIMLVRPQSKKAKQHRIMQEGLAKGDEVVTDGGLMGKILHIGDNAITVQLAENLEVKVRRESINAVMPKGTLKQL